MSLKPVTPLRNIAPYFGGKTLMVRRLNEMIRAIPHRCYAEPFVGSGAVFFGRDARPPVEIINDLNGEVTNCLRWLREHPSEVARAFRLMPASRAEFERQLDLDPATLTELQRATRFLYLQRLRFSGMPRSRSFGASKTTSKARDLAGLRRKYSALGRRLERVMIEQMPYDQFIAHYDGPETLFYVDPPYWGLESQYGKGLFGRSDFQGLADQFAALKGQFILSLNDRPEVREIFARFEIREIPITYSTGKGARKRTHELIISGGGR